MRFLSTVIFILLVSWLTFPEKAVAQQATYLNAPAPEKVAITPGGVDIRTGRYQYEKTDVKIGDGTNGSISVERMMPTPIIGHTPPFGNFSHNWEIMLTITSSGLDQYPGNFDYVANVHFGGRSQTCQKLYLQDTTFRQQSRNAVTRLTSVPAAWPNETFTYEANDGTVAEFRPIFVPNSYGGISKAFVSYVIEPDVRAMISNMIVSREPSVYVA